MRLLDPVTGPLLCTIRMCRAPSGKGVSGPSYSLKLSEFPVVEADIKYYRSSVVVVYIWKVAEIPKPHALGLVGWTCFGPEMNIKPRARLGTEQRA